MKILITGGTGFIGSYLSGDIMLSSKDINLMNLDKTIECFKKHSPDIVIHCAAKQKNYLYMNTMKADHMYDNTLINMNVFKAVQESGVRKIVSISSINAFPANSDNYYREDNLWNGEPHHSCYTDGYKNRLLHIFSKAYNSQYGIECAVPMLSNTYGPRSRAENGVIPILIKKCYDAKINNSDFVIEGDGSPTRDFIFVRDVAKLVDWAVKNYNSIAPIIFSSGKATTIKEIVEMIVQYMRFTGSVVWTNTKVIGQHTKLCDNNLLMSHLPDFQFTSMEVGLKETVKWFEKSRKHYGGI